MATQIQDQQFYYIQNLKTQTFLNLYNSGPPGTQVVGAINNWWDAGSLPINSIWQAQQDQNTKNWRFLCAATNTYMYFESSANGQNLVIWDSVPDLAQRWNCTPTVSKAQPAYFQIANANSGLVLDLANGNSINGAQVMANFAVPGDVNQQWVFIPTTL